MTDNDGYLGGSHYDRLRTSVNSLWIGGFEGCMTYWEMHQLAYPHRVTIDDVVETAVQKTYGVRTQDTA